MKVTQIEEGQPGVERPEVPTKRDAALILEGLSIFSDYSDRRSVAGSIDKGNPC